MEAVLGHGGMGVVYQARQCALDRRVAVKMLLAGSLAGPQELARFRRETAALACLRHPNIVPVYDAGDAEGRPYFTMEEARTTVIIQGYLDALPGDAAEPMVRELLERAVGRLRQLYARFLYKSYPRLTRPPVNLETDELLRAVVAGLLTALRTTRPPTVRRLFALANQHMRWQLNDLARRLDERPAAAALAESGVAAPPSSTDSGLSPDGRRMLEVFPRRRCSGD